MTLQGLVGILIDVEVDVSNGMPVWNIVGLPDTGIKESKERIKTAIKNCGIDLPSRKYIINLSPGDIRKEGTGFDLAIAIGILKSIGQIKSFHSKNVLFVGELSLNGKINKINGILPICLESIKHGIKRIILSKENAKEASVVKELEVIGVASLLEVIKYLNDEVKILPEETNIDQIFKEEQNNIDFSEVKGQETIKRALEIAAARRS